MEVDEGHYSVYFGFILFTWYLKIPLIFRMILPIIQSSVQVPPCPHTLCQISCRIEFQGFHVGEDAREAASTSERRVLSVRAIYFWGLPSIMHLMRCWRALRITASSHPVRTTPRRTCEDGSKACKAYRGPSNYPSLQRKNSISTWRSSNGLVVQTEAFWP